jgi:hypothetical protein
MSKLTDFDWEEEDNFFDIPTPGVLPVEPKKVEPKTPEAKVEPTKVVEEEEEDEDDAFFDEIKNKGIPSDEEDEEEDEDEPKKKDATTAEGSIYKDLILDSKEAGLFKHIEINEDEEIDADRFAELQEEEYEAEVSARLEQWATKDLDADAKAFIKFKREGGSTEDFFNTYAGASEIPTGDIDDEDYQDAIIRFQLAEEGWDREEIEDRLKYLTETDKKEKVAKKYDARAKQLIAEEKQELLNQANAQKAALKAQEDKFKLGVKTVLDTKDEISGFKINQKEKAELINFLTRKDHKAGGDKSITGFQKKLGEVFQDTDKLVLLAKLINSDFDMSDFEKKVTTKNTKKIKTNLEQRKSLRPAASGSSAEGKSLADFFN